MIPFRIVRPITLDGKTWMPGQESRMRMTGKWNALTMADAIEKGKILPAFDDESWYKGPHHKLLWEQDLYTEKQIWRIFVETKKHVEHIGKKRREQIVSHLKAKLIS